MARSFANLGHLVGLGRQPAAALRARAEETDDERREREEAEQRERDEDMRRMEDSGDDTGESEDERRERHDREESRRRAQGESEDPDEEDEDGDDDGDRREAHGHGTVARARRRERGRIAAILSSPQAAANLPLAVELACNSAMSRDQVIRTLARTPAPARADRAARNPTGLGGHAAPASGSGSDARIQDMWGHAFSRIVPAMRQAQRR